MKLIEEIKFEVCRPSLSGVFRAASETVWQNRDVIDHTNCYAYALNCPEMGFARPGKLKDPFNDELGCSITRENLERFLEEDGLEQIGETEALNGSRHVLALRFRNRLNFHFYRRDADGSWSFKDGTWPPSNLIWGRPISNPALIKSRRYPEFAGFWAIPESGILYLRRLDIAA